MALSTLAATPALAADGPKKSPYTVEQLAKVRDVLAKRGATASQIDQVLADPELVAAIPMSIETGPVVAGKPTKVQAPKQGAGGISPMSIGNTCSGYQNWVELTLKIRSLAGVELGHFRLHQDFCYDLVQVTYSSYYIDAGVTVTGTIGGLQYEGVPSGVSEAFQIWDGHANGQARTYAQGKFRTTILWVGEIGAVYPTITLYGRYHGTWDGSGTCNWCTL
jgi:hypothetical protein